MRWGSVLFYSLISILAMNFLALVILVGGHYYAGRVAGKDLMNMLLVLTGNRRYTMDVREIQELARFREEDAAKQKKLEEEKGKPEAREASARAFLEQQKQLQIRYDELSGQIKKDAETLQALRTEIEGAKAQIQKEREMLSALREQNLKVETDENTKKVIKTLQNLDAENVARFFQDLMRGRPADGKYEVVRIMRQYLKPDQIAEILAAMKPDEVQQILPLLENNYAGLTPAEVLDRWTNPAQRDRKTAPEMFEYMKQMPFLQAFQIYLLLDPETKRQMVQGLQQK